MAYRQYKSGDILRMYSIYSNASSYVAILNGENLYDLHAYVLFRKKLLRLILIYFRSQYIGSGDAIDYIKTL